MQYKTGTVSVTNGSATVTGSGTAWTTNVDPGDLFLRRGDAVTYLVAAVVSDTQLTLSTTYQGATATGQTYAVTRDFTPFYGIPYPQDGDIGTATLFKRAVFQLENLIVNTVKGSPSVESQTTATPPTSPEIGQVWLIPATGATGEWAGQGNKIALWRNPWEFFTPEEGSRVWVRDEKVEMLWNGIRWVDSTAGLTQILDAVEGAQLSAQQADASADAAAVDAASALSSKTAAQTAANTATTKASEAATSATTATAGANTATTKALQASTSATNAAASATTASTKATEASASAAAAVAARDATIIAQAAAEDAEDAAALSATAAAASEADAEAAALAAMQAELDAEAAAATATTKAAEAVTSATTATTKAAEASASATTATTKASEASASAAAAALSETNAATSATNASTSEANALLSQQQAATSSTTATTKAGEAATSAAAAAVSAADAETAKVAAQQAATTSQNAASDSISAKTDAVAAKVVAEAARDSASTSELLSRDWATKAANTEVIPGFYSSYHWSEIAKGHAQTAQNIVNGYSFGYIMNSEDVTVVAAATQNAGLKMLAGANIALDFSQADSSITVSYTGEDPVAMSIILGS